MVCVSLSSSGILHEFYSDGISWRQFDLLSTLYKDMRWRANGQVCFVIVILFMLFHQQDNAANAVYVV